MKASHLLVSLARSIVAKDGVTAAVDSLGRFVEVTIRNAAMAITDTSRVSVSAKMKAPQRL